jgi:hypothetical protein
MGTEESFKATIRELSVEDYWQKLVDIGWVSHVPEDKQASLKSSLEEAFAEPDLVWRYHAFYVLRAAAFDAELVQETGPSRFSYYWVIQHLAESSHGLFCPEGVVDELDAAKETARVSFRHGGQRFEREVPWHSDWFDLQILDLVNEALGASGTEARFIPLPGSDQVLQLVLVPETTYAAAVESGLIPAGDAFTYDE